MKQSTLNDRLKPEKLAARLFVGLQYLLPHHFLSSLMYRITRVEWPGVKNLLINKVIQWYRVDMQEALDPNPTSYRSFNDFFTRALNPDIRPVDEAGTENFTKDGAHTNIGMKVALPPHDVRRALVVSINGTIEGEFHETGHGNWAFLADFGGNDIAQCMHSTVRGVELANARKPSEKLGYGKNRCVFQPDVRAEGFGLTPGFRQPADAQDQRGHAANRLSSPGKRFAEDDALRDRPRLQDQAV